MDAHATRRCFGLALAAVLCGCLARPTLPEPERFTFGVVADVQYADKPTRGSRRYREAPAKLAACVDDWNRRELAFAIQLGDIVDGRPDLEDTRRDLEVVMAEFARVRAPLRHVVGNHCLSMPRAELMARLGLERGWYDFAHGGWRFVVLDGMDVNALDPDPRERARLFEFTAARPGVAGRVGTSWNGGVGDEQQRWLRGVLAEAGRRRERVVVFCHHPVLEAAAEATTLLWNHEEIAAVVEAFPCVVAFVSGHHHAGGYAQRNGVHHVTLPALLDAPEGGNAYAFVDALPDRLEIRGVGTVPSRVLNALRR